MRYQIEARSRQDQLIKALGLSRADLVVDLGCATGYFVSLIQQEAGTTIGIDVDLSPLKFAKTFCKGQEFILADVTKIPIRDQSVNKVLCTEVLEHVIDDSAVANECYRILRAGGVSVLSSPNASFPIRSKKSSHTEAGPELHVRSGYSPSQIKDLLRRAGFAQIQLAFALPLIGALLVEALERLYTISRGPLKSQIELQRAFQSRVFELYKLAFPLFLLVVRIPFPSGYGGSILISKAKKS